MLISLWPAAALAALLLLLFAMTLKDKSDYARFKLARGTGARRAFYRQWIMLCWILFGLGGLGILAALGATDALVVFPSEFAALDLRRSAEVPPLAGMGLSTMLGIATGLALGAVISAVVWRWRLAPTKPPVIGDIEPLLPREKGEYPYTAALSITAGVTEELFFRLTLPLLAYAATGSALAGFVIAGAAFGLMHWYQGWTGVIATTLVGTLLAYLYLSSGSLIKPILVHILIDLVALVVRPALAARASRKIAYERRQTVQGEAS
ncbi:CPBP family intramembrane glutamic endopeptidase [Sphingomicrobium flavum]|uniref:CPBP family intramembrane glutamic endopeptidase n=1 Tax=Sphingomicrobium flavum TaxID=1229164 RepID=UPI0021ADA35D|nr:CPBP family intramembrane glutamic endopeptidase [Sphingomicrobium flavum]